MRRLDAARIAPSLTSTHPPNISPSMASPPKASAAVIAFGIYRTSYRSAVAKAREEMGRALDSVAASVRLQSLFGTTALPRRPVAPRGSSDDGTIMLIG